MSSKIKAIWTKCNILMAELSIARVRANLAGQKIRSKRIKLKMQTLIKFQNSLTKRV